MSEAECPVPCPWRRWDWALEPGEHAVSSKRIGTVDCETENGDVDVAVPA